MIDINSEHLLAIREVPARLPARPTRRRVHISAVYRWMSRGVAGVRLEWTKVGTTRYTSAEALQRFANELAHAGQREWQREPPPPKTRQKQVEKAAHDVDSILRGRNKKDAPNKLAR